MTIIFSNREDLDSLVLKRVFQRLNAKILEILPNSIDWENSVDLAISEEKDTIVFIGHGTSKGLLFPDFNTGEYILHENNVNLIKAERVLCLWCYASYFSAEQNIHNSVSSSMFISNEKEAEENDIYDSTQIEISKVCEKIYLELVDLIQRDVPIEQWTMSIGVKVDEDKEVDVFNRRGFYYNE